MRSFHLLSPLLLLATDLALSKASELYVQTSVGKVMGFIDPAIPGVRQWLGVPFAEPPLGPLRFLPPVKKRSRSDVLMATTAPPSCQQYLTTAPNINDLVPEFNPPKPWDEDCLYLNVIAPVRPKTEKLPVAIWFYGGEQTFGSINTPYEKSQKWVQRSQEHIVVQVAYRMNILGFPNAPGLNQSELNLGVLDFRTAIEWVRDNIANFGGDPCKIALWGQAAGAGLVDNYQLSFADDPIAHAMILESAVVFMGNFTSDPEQTSWRWVAGQYNCTGTAEQVVDCMRAVNASSLETLLQGHTGSPPLTFGAVADNRTGFSKSQYQEMIASRSFPKLPALIGSNYHEGASFIPYNADGINMTEAKIEAATLSVVQCPLASEAALRVQGGAKTWRYYYHGNFTNISPKPWMGAYHFAELPMIMGTHADYRGNSTPFEYALSATMQDYWLAFIKDPEHGLEVAGWPEYTGRNGKIAVLGEDDKLMQLQSATIVDAGLGNISC